MSIAQGCGSCTPFKIEIIRSVLIERIIQLQKRQKTIHVYDVYSGFGMNYTENERTFGTPHTAWSVAQLFGVECFLSDIDEFKIGILEENIKNWNKYSPKHHTKVHTDTMSAQERLEQIIAQLETPHHNAHPIVILDPNGPKQLPIDTLRRISGVYGIDFIINIPERTFRVNANVYNSTMINFIYGYSKYVAKYKQKHAYGRMGWCIFAHFARLDCKLNEHMFTKMHKGG